MSPGESVVGALGGGRGSLVVAFCSYPISFGVVSKSIVFMSLNNLSNSQI